MSARDVVLAPLPSLQITVRWPNGVEFTSTTTYSDWHEGMGNKVWLDSVETLTLSAVDAGMMVGQNKGFPLIEQD